MRKKTILVAIFVLIVFTGLAIMLAFGASKEGAYTGFDQESEGSFDLSPDDKQLVFTYSVEGKQAIYISGQDGSNPFLLVSQDQGKSLHHPTFTTDGKSVFYIESAKTNEQVMSNLYVINVDGSGKKQVLAEDAAITDIVMAQDGKTIYYLRAGVYTNYSPVTGKRPHEYDIWSAAIDGTNRKPVTSLKKYEISSLNLSADGKKLYFRTTNDLQAKTPEDIFAAKEAMFSISLDNPENLSLVDIDHEPQVFQLATSPLDGTLAYTSIANPAGGGTFEYELYLLETQTRQSKKLTQFKSHVGNPKFTQSGKQIYFMVNHNFAKKLPDYQLYRINIDGSGIEKIEIQMTEENKG